MSTAIVASTYERIVADYLEEVEGYLCKTDVEFLKTSKSGERVRSDIDISAYELKEHRFLVCEVISITPTTQKEKKETVEKISTISGPDIKRFLKECYGVDDYAECLSHGHYLIG